MSDSTTDRTPPSGGATDAGALAQGNMNVTEGEEARQAYPVQVDAAIAYAADNKYEYGPKFRRVDLQHSVVSARLMDEGIVRVTLEYKPAAKFRGGAGREYLDVAKDGEVLARRQLRVPKEDKPWVLISLAAISVIAAAILIPLMLTVEDNGNNLYVSGRTLWFLSSEPEKMPFIRYTGITAENEFAEFVIVPEGENTQLIMIHMTIYNQTSGSVNLNVDREAVELTLDNGTVLRPINVLEEARTPLEESDPKYTVQGFIPIWGSSVMDSNTQLAGYFVFEAPIGTDARSLRWGATDVATIRY